MKIPAQTIALIQRALTGPLKRTFRGEAAPRVWPLPEWLQQGFKNSGIEQATGRWWAETPEQMDWYVNDAGPGAQRFALDLPEELMEQLRVTKAPPDVQKFSLDKENEYFVPKYLTALRRALK